MTAVFDRLDSGARRVFEIAQHEARRLDHNYLGTEHLLLGLNLGGGSAAGLLLERGCRPEEIRGEIITIVGRGHPPPHQPDELLATLGIDLGEVRRRVESTFGPDAVRRSTLRARPRRRWPGHRWWPGCDGGQPCSSTLAGGRWLGLAPRVKRVAEIATTLAAPSSATPTHLLVGILDEGEGVACQLLARRGVNLADLAAVVRAQLL